jgi:hypothetical protein
MYINFVRNISKASKILLIYYFNKVISLLMENFNCYFKIEIKKNN